MSVSRCSIPVLLQLITRNPKAIVSWLQLLLDKAFTNICSGPTIALKPFEMGTEIYGNLVLRSILWTGQHRGVVWRTIQWSSEISIAWELPNFKPKEECSHSLRYSRAFNWRENQQGNMKKRKWTNDCKCHTLRHCCCFHHHQSVLM